MISSYRQFGVVFLIGVICLVAATYYLAGYLPSLGVWQGEEILLVVILGILCILPIVLAIHAGRFDIFDPIYVVSFVAFSVNVLGAMTMIASSEVTIMGIALRDQLQPALLLSIFGLLATYAGYLWGRYQFSDERNSWVRDVFSRMYRPHLVFRWCILGVIVATGFFLFWVFSSGLSLNALNQVLSDDSPLGGPLSGNSSPMYFYMFRESWPAFILLAWTMARHRSSKTLVLILWLLNLFVYFIQGTRGSMYNLCIATIMLWYLQRSKRPTVLTLVIGFTILMLASGYMVLTRRTQVEETTVSNVLAEAAGDFSERNAFFGLMVTMKLIPDVEPYQGLGMFNEVFLAWIPRSIWPEKPSMGLPPVLLNHFAVIEGSTIGMIGYLYLGMGPVGVLVGFGVLGALNALIYEYWRSKPSAPIRQVFFALWPVFLLHVLERGSYAGTLSRFIYWFGPLFVVWFLSVGRQSDLEVNHEALQL